ncbi:hypothetical protein HYQ46_006781 [Verticillium longisporum]|nr:hypothetical protein HYQ46_006781 [Verticillium longisporum]
MINLGGGLVRVWERLASQALNTTVWLAALANIHRGRKHSGLNRVPLEASVCPVIKCRTLMVLVNTVFIAEQWSSRQSLKRRRQGMPGS